MTKFFTIFKRPCFWPTFPILGAKVFFLENPALSRTTSYWFLASCQNLEKTNDTIPRNRPDWWKDGRKDRQTLFHRTLQVNDGGPKVTLWTPLCSTIRKIQHIQVLILPGEYAAKNRFTYNVLHLRNILFDIESTYTFSSCWMEKQLSWFSNSNIFRCKDTVRYNVKCFL